MIYNAAVPAAELLATAKQLTAAGESVLLRTAAPEGIRYKRLIDLCAKEGC